MFLSVIIPTRNRVSLLVRTIESIAKVDYPGDEFEVIVVDTCSTDATPVACQSLIARQVIRNLRYERCERPGLHVGRHRGATIAEGNVLVYGDDDIVPESSWLSAVREGFSDSAVALVGGNNLPDYQAMPPAWTDELWRENDLGRYNSHYSLIDFGLQPKAIPAEFVFGCNFSIRKATLTAAGGFHPDGMPKALLRYRGDGESAVSWALTEAGAKVLFHPGASVKHWVPTSRMTPEYIAFRGYIQGISDSYTRVRKMQATDPTRGLVLNLLRRAKCRGLHVLRRSRPETWAGRGYEKGYRFHQQEIAHDPKLMQWVLQHDYWDESLSPKLT